MTWTLAFQESAKFMANPPPVFKGVCHKSFAVYFFMIRTHSESDSVRCHSHRAELTFNYLGEIEIQLEFFKLVCQLPSRSILITQGLPES